MVLNRKYQLKLCDIFIDLKEAKRKKMYYLNVPNIIIIITCKDFGNLIPKINYPTKTITYLNNNETRLCMF